MGKQMLWRSHLARRAACSWCGAGEGGGGSGDGARSVPRWRGHAGSAGARGSSSGEPVQGCPSPSLPGHGPLACARLERAPGRSPTPQRRQRRSAGVVVARAAVSLVSILDLLSLPVWAGPGAPSHPSSGAPKFVAKVFLATSSFVLQPGSRLKQTMRKSA